MSRHELKILAFGGCLLLLQSHLIKAQDSRGGAVTVSPDDRKFILDAAQSGLHEVQMAMLAIERGTNTNVKVYAQHILDDQALSNAQVEALARLKGIALPDPTKTDPVAVKLSHLSGTEFDTAFVHDVIENHLRDLAEFEKEDQSTAADADIKGYAHGALPKLHAHLDQANALKP